MAPRCIKYRASLCETQSAQEGFPQVTMHTCQNHKARVFANLAYRDTNKTIFFEGGSQENGIYQADRLTSLGSTLNRIIVSLPCLLFRSEFHSQLRPLHPSLGN